MDAPTFPINGFKLAEDLVVNDFLHGPCPPGPGRVVYVQRAGDRYIDVTVATPHEIGTTRVARTQNCEITRLVDENLDPS